MSEPGHQRVRPKHPAFPAPFFRGWCLAQPGRFRAAGMRGCVRSLPIFRNASLGWLLKMRSMHARIAQPSWWGARLSRNHPKGSGEAVRPPDDACIAGRATRPEGAVWQGENRGKRRCIRLRRRWRSERFVVTLDVARLRRASGAIYPRGLIDPLGNCPWPGPWIRTYGAHLLS